MSRSGSRASSRRSASSPAASSASTSPSASRWPRRHPRSARCSAGVEDGRPEPGPPVAGVLNLVTVGAAHVMSYKHTGVPIPQVMYSGNPPEDRRPRETDCRRPGGSGGSQKWAELGKEFDRKINDDATPAAERESLVAARKSAVAAAQPIDPYLKPFARMDRKNMLALMFCLMVGQPACAHPDALLHGALGQGHAPRSAGRSSSSACSISPPPPMRRSRAGRC